MVSDPIADMLARIRNAALAHHEVTRMPLSKIKVSIAEILKREGYIADVRTEEVAGKPSIILSLKYDRDRSPAFRKLRRISRPGRRVYVGHTDIPRVMSGLGLSILSTSQGLLTDREARTRKVGGELLCEVY